MFFNSKKYTQEAEKNRRHDLSDEPSMFNMISLGILASFIPTRFLLRLHKQHIENKATIEEKAEVLNRLQLFTFMVFAEEIILPRS